MKLIRIIMLGCLVLPGVAFSETITLSKAVNKLVEYYPTLHIARLKTEQAKWEIRNVNNQLSWKLNGSAGIVHDVSAFGTPFDQFEASANLNRKLSSGHSLGFSGRYQYNDDSFVLNNSFPNPSQSLDFDVNYRIPLGKGAGDTGYQQSVIIAQSRKQIEQLNEKAILKSLTANIIDLFHEIHNLQQRLSYTETSIDRSRRLKDYISRNIKLGIYEDKDVLESNAQLLKVISERESLQLALVEQKNALKKLLGLNPGEPVQIKLEKFSSSNTSVDELLQAAEKDDPQLQIQNQLLDIADADIFLSLNENADKKDLVFSLGARTLYGDSQTGDVSEEDYAAQLKFEYEYDLGNYAYQSRIEKAKRQKDISLQEIRLNKDGIKYQVTALLEKISKQYMLVDKLKKHRDVSQDKFDEATARYRQGRIDTTKLIQFENDLHLANLDLSSARTDISKSQTRLSLLIGELLPMLDVKTTVQ